MYIIIGVVLLMVVIVWLVHHQRKLRLRAHLMQEAISNRDFTFRLPVNGLLPGERAMQQTLNQLGNVIRQQVYQTQVESWERLIRVLTHEIMNATAPITSISQLLLSRDDVKGTPLEEGIATICHTSQHLSVFIDSYRKLSYLQQPSITEVQLTDLLKDVRQLYPGIQWQCSIVDDSIVSADPNMLRQILINLVKNAMEAGAQTVAADYEAATLFVSNDGKPIPAEARKSIFVPFFTTKRTGSGIGLSLSRHMMVQQGGNLSLAEVPKNGYTTTFILELQRDADIRV